MSGFLLLFNHLFLPSLEREQERKFFAFCVPLLAALGLLGQPLAARATRGNERRGPPSLSAAHLAFLSGETRPRKVCGSKIQPCRVRGVKVKHQPADGPLITRQIPARQGKSLPGDTRRSRAAETIGNRKCALSGAAFGRGDPLAHEPVYSAAMLTRGSQPPLGCIGLNFCCWIPLEMEAACKLLHTHIQTEPIKLFFPPSSVVALLGSLSFHLAPGVVNLPLVSGGRIH